MDGLGTEASVRARTHTHAHTHTHTHDGFRSHRGSSDGGKAPSCFVSAFQSGPRLSLARPCASCMSACGACVRVRGGEHAVCAKPCVYPCFAHWHAGSRACFDPCRHARARGCGMRAHELRTRKRLRGGNADSAWRLPHAYPEHLAMSLSLLLSGVGSGPASTSDPPRRRSCSSAARVAGRGPVNSGTGERRGGGVGWRGGATKPARGSGGQGSGTPCLWRTARPLEQAGPAPARRARWLQASRSRPWPL